MAATCKYALPSHLAAIASTGRCACPELQPGEGPGTVSTSPPPAFNQQTSTEPLAETSFVTADSRNRLGLWMIDQVRLAAPEAAMLGIMVHGSHAYGMAHSASDIDLRSVFVASNDRLLGINGKVEHVSRLAHDGALYDATGYELGRFGQMLASSDIGAVEMLYADEVLIMGNPSLGWDRLKDLRSTVLSKQMIGRYLGFAGGQAKMVENGAGGTKDPARRGKTQRHAVRLMLQAHRLKGTAQFSPMVSPENRVIIERAGTLDTTVFLTEFQSMIDTLNEMNAHPSLPERPDVTAINSAVLAIRNQSAIRSMRIA
jgi:predicted nucleotidyltransferase